MANARMSSRRPRKREARFERDDWIELGLKELSRRGPEALRLERITEAAAKTRGSFYHHFEDHQAFLAALAQRWRERTEAAIVEAEAAAASGKRREVLARRSAEVDHALERHLRTLASTEPLIARAVAAVDQRRMGYVADLFVSEMGVERADAEARARIQHCAFVGAQMVFPDADERMRLKLEAALGRALWRK